MNLNGLNITSWKKLNVNYWGITKCGNSTVKTHLYCLENNIPFKDFGISIHGNTKIDYITPEFAKTNGKINFTVTRNPYDRFLSMYKDLVLIRKHRGKHSGFKGNTLDELIDFVSSISDENRDFHFKTQNYFISREMDYVIDLYKMKEDWPFDFKYPKNVVHKSNSNFNILTNKQKDRIYEIYRIDFDKFGYDR